MQRSGHSHVVVSYVFSPTHAKKHVKHRLMAPSHAPNHPSRNAHSIPLAISPPLKPLRLMRLTPIRSSALLLLVPAHASAQRDVHPRRCRESKGLGHLDQIQLVHVEDASQTVRGVRLEVAAVALLG